MVVICFSSIFPLFLYMQCSNFINLNENLAASTLNLLIFNRHGSLHGKKKKKVKRKERRE